MLDELPTTAPNGYGIGALALVVMVLAMEAASHGSVLVAVSLAKVGIVVVVAASHGIMLVARLRLSTDDTREGAQETTGERIEAGKRGSNGETVADKLGEPG